jgi:peptide/nickel transport system ATP-binding protein
MSADLVVEKLTKSYTVESGRLFGAARQVHALREVSFRLPQGQSLGVVGESGSGKTTLAKILAGFIPADAGSARLGDRDLLSLRRKERARILQMVFQDPFGSINPKLLLGAQLREAMPAGEADGRMAAVELMADVGLSGDHLARYPHQISGGQRQRFAIARALAAQPSLLIADEPVSSLDLSVQAQIINLLNQLRRSRGFSQIVIAHDLAVIANTCESVIVMKDGAAVESGLVADVLENPRHPYTQRLLSAVPVLRP